MKKKILTHIQYRSALYIAALLLPIIVWCSVYSSLAKPKDREKVAVSYFGGGCDIVALQEDVTSRLGSITDNAIKVISLESAASSRDSMFYSLVEARTYTSDILIFAPDMWDEALLTGSVLPIPEAAVGELKKKLPADTEYCVVNGRVYGVIISGDAGKNKFSEHCEYEGKALAIFSSQSVNAGGIFGKGDKSDDAAIELICYFLQGAEK